MEVMVVHHPVNYWAVLVAAAAYWVLGAIWYAGPLFGNAWMKGIGKTKEQVQADFSPLKLVFAFITAFVACYGIARILYWTGGESITDGIRIGLLAGVCFVWATLCMHDTMEGRPKWFTWLNALYSIVGLVVAGAIIGAW